MIRPLFLVICLFLCTTTAAHLQDTFNDFFISLRLQATRPPGLLDVLPDDLILTEIMANPRDAAGLPEAEYIELYNNSTDVLQLAGIQYSSGGAPKVLPEYLLPPGSFVIITNSTNADAFPPEIAVIGISSFPALSNGGDEVKIALPDGRVIQQVFYDESWYQDRQKASGGFSLERIAFDLPENCPGNWRAANAAAGGTPSGENSLSGAPLEINPPVLSTVFALNDQVLKLGFDETLGSFMLDPGNYSISPALPFDSILLSGSNQDTVTMLLTQAITQGVVYTLQIQRTEDCLGNLSNTAQELSFAIPEPAVPGDILINEVLFNPQSGGKDFIELYNASRKVLSLLHLEIINTQKTSGSAQTRLEFEQLLLPGRYLALSSDPADLRLRYPLPADAGLREAPLPTLDARAGNVTLQQNGILLDAFDYREEQHSQLLENQRGVSLERLSPSLPTQSDDNWSSAAQAVGFATPGYANSQTILPPGVQTELFALPQKTFSPDGDGFEDLLVINYQNTPANYLVNVRIFDAQGRPVKILAQNESLATEGILTWDGSTDDGTKARVGVYVIWIEAFSPRGDKRVEKLTCILAGKL